MAHDDTERVAAAALAATAPFSPDPTPSVEHVLSAVDTGALSLGDDEERYARGAELGAGGMGVVRLDRDRRIGRSVARKVLKRNDDAQWARRFLREARIQGQLEHPAIPPVYDVGRNAEGELYFTMKRLRGVTMEEILGGLARRDAGIRERFPRRRLLSALLTVCDALDYAHSRGVVHRDLKPSNVMLGEYGEVWVLDWGIARLADDTGASLVRDRVAPVEEQPEVSRGRLTAPGEVIGTMHYISPEQMRDEPLDGRADVFALGMMLFEVLTLRRFRQDEGWMRLLSQLADGKAARPAEVDPSVEPELDAICARATAPDRKDRYASARDLRAAIDAFLAGERDADQREAAGARIVDDAARRLEQCERTADGDARRIASARADAMHEALRALALDPDHRQAKAFVGELLDRVTGEPPPEAAEEAARARAQLRHEGMRTARLGFISWVVPLPLILLLGVRDWTAFAVGVSLLIAGLVLTTDRIRKGESKRFDGYVMAAVISCLLLLMSGFLGPFVVVPVVGTASAMAFAMHATRDERIRITAMLCFAAMLPFVLDASGLVPPGFEFAGDGIVLHPRLLDLPPFYTVLGLLWTSGSSIVVSAFIVGRMRDRLDHAERRLHLSAWHLRQLFPAAATASETAG